jgi:hypothetical protein
MLSARKLMIMPIWKFGLRICLKKNPKPGLVNALIIDTGNQ